MRGPTADGEHPAGQEQLLADLVHQVTDYAIIALDRQGIISSWNAGAERLKGYTSEQAIGRSFAMFYPTDDRRRGLPADLLRQAEVDGHVQCCGWRVRRDGGRFWADVTITALHDDEGALTGYAKVTRDLTEQHDLEMRLRESEERLRLLVGQVVDYAIIALDPQGVIETWNLGAERLKGYTSEQAIGHSFARFYTSEDQQRGLPAKLLEIARVHGRAAHAGWRVRRDGSTFWADVTITALHDDDGLLTGFAKVTRDRTDIKRLEEAQDAFYASFTHDFRTPIAVVRGYAEAARDAVDDPELRDDMLRRVEAGADRLEAMVEGLVDFARQRVGQVEIELADIDVIALTRTTVAELGSRVTGDRVDVAPGVGLARANGEAMRRVLVNLLLNALKYSEPETRVEVRFARRAGWTEMTVVDRGRGIHADDLPTIFDQFQRGRLSVSDGGTGLGLSSVRELVERQEGTVSITSTVGEGTEVTVRLPASLDMGPLDPDIDTLAAGLA